MFEYEDKYFNIAADLFETVANSRIPGHKREEYWRSIALALAEYIDPQKKEFSTEGGFLPPMFLIDPRPNIRNVLGAICLEYKKINDADEYERKLYIND